MQNAQRVPGTPVTLTSIPEGRAGVRATLKLMERLIRGARRDHSIRETALALVAQIPQKNFIAEVDAIFRFVKDRIRYVQDPVGLETIAEPWKTIELRQGDCDDKAVLAAALLQSIGHPVRLVAVGFDGQPISHVYVETQIGPNWVPLETTDSRMRLGEYPDGITEVMTQYIGLGA